MRFLIFLLTCFILSSCLETSGHNDSIERNSDVSPNQEEINLQDSVVQIIPSSMLNSQLNESYLLHSDLHSESSIISDTSVRSIGKGVVRRVAPGSVVIVYQHLENARLISLETTYSHDELSVSVEEGDTVSRNQTLGTVPEFYNLKSTLPVKRNTQFTVPLDEEAILIIDKNQYHMWFLKNGSVFNHYDIALGQNPIGHKIKQGDNRTPEGEYYIVEKLKGPFYSPTAAYLGNTWFRLSYPNEYDAITGYENGLISIDQKNAITYASRNKKDTPNYTALGGDIGIHGWKGDWYEYSTWDITWGCVSMRNNDIDSLYHQITIPVKVLILGENAVP